MADEPAHIHYSTRLGKDLVLQRHAKNQFGWLGVYAKKEKLGIVYHAKLRLDPSKKDQTTLPGEGLFTPLEAAIRYAEYVAEHPFPTKASKVRRQSDSATLLSSLLSRAGLLSLSHVPQRKAEAVAEVEAEAGAELLSSRPAWVIDHNTATLWQRPFFSEDMIPENIRLSAAATAELLRLREWAAGAVVELEEATEAEVEAPPPPLTLMPLSPTPLPALPTATPATAIVQPYIFNGAAIAQAAALKSGPRVGGSPDTVLGP